MGKDDFLNTFLVAHGSLKRLVKGGKCLLLCQVLSFQHSEYIMDITSH